MKFVSTRNSELKVNLSEALQMGLAKDGGLYIPEYFPQFDWESLDPNISYPDFAYQLLKPFFDEDELKEKLHQICKESFTFEAPVITLDEHNYVLELFHGPTLSFKDFGARFLASCLSQIKSNKSFSILVATSGDTGSAVAAAFYQKPNINVVVMFPEGKISHRQERQITCWGDNVLALSVKGNFDDCQRLVKEAFGENWWHQRTYLNTSNSINIGRLLPQSSYYAYSAWQFYIKHKKQANYIVPSGNIGNVTACFWAKKMGLPIGDIVISQNENNVIGEYLQTQLMPNKKSIETLANAMDVGKPSNFERLSKLLGSFDAFKATIKSYKAADTEIIEAIKKAKEKYNYIACPHTATAFFARENQPFEEKLKPYLMVATADPAKFNDVVEPALEEKVELPQRLKLLLEKEQTAKHIVPDMQELMNVYSTTFDKTP